MQQYFINENVEMKSYILSKEDSFHIVKVMRKQNGDKIFIAFANKERYICNIVDNNIDGVVIEPVEKVETTTELNAHITIAIPPLKNDKFEYLIQKATELGVSEIVIFNSERNVAKIKEDKVEAKIKRWEKIVKEASEQSKRAIIPTITYCKNIKSVIENYDSFNYKVIAYENEAQNDSNDNLKQLLNNDLQQKSIIAIFGSEGGLALKEVEQFNANNYASVGLGKRILRAETAPLYLVSCLAYFIELN